MVFCLPNADSICDALVQALDEQQSRLVSLQMIGKQQADDIKAVSLNVAENGERLKGIESRGIQDQKASHDSLSRVSSVLQGVKEQMVALQETDSARAKSVKDRPLATNEDINELQKVCGFTVRYNTFGY